MTSKNRETIESGNAESAVEGDPRWEVTLRAASSRALTRASSLRAILFYVVHQVILHPTERIGEYEIALGALGRSKNFIPLEDNIVRVQVGHLRKKLELYFSTEGSEEELVISIPLGSYTPEFKSRRQTTSPFEPPNNAEITATQLDTPLPVSREPAAEPPSPEASKDGTPHRTIKILWMSSLLAAALIVGAIAGFLLRPPTVVYRKAPTISNPILRRLFATNAGVNVVVADTALVVLQYTLHSNLTISDYTGPNYPEDILARVQDTTLRTALRAITHHDYTSLGDADVVGKCFYWGAILDSHPFVRFARDMHVRDFEHGNYVIVGSRRGNPWSSLFDRNLNFSFEEDPATHVFYFRNRHPKPGEALNYVRSSEAGGSTVGYVDVAMLPNLARTGTVLLLNGSSMEDTEAAAELVLNSVLPPVLAHALPSASRNQDIEIFLKVYSLEGSAQRMEVISVRTAKAFSKDAND